MMSINGISAGIENGLLASCKVSAGGMALTVNAQAALASETTMARLVGQLGNMLNRRQAVAVRTTQLGSATIAEANFEAICRRLAELLRRVAVDPTALELSLDKDSVPPATAWQIRKDIIGAGVLSFVCHPPVNGGENPGQERRQRDGWCQLWQLRSEQQVQTAFWPQVTSRCALLESENAASVLPEVGLQAPAESAWLLANVDLAAYANARGVIDSAMLELALLEAVDIAEETYEIHRWPTPTMQHDAWLNRRVAVCVQGIGDLVCRRGLQPDRHECLESMHELMRSIRRVLDSRSRQLARSDDVLPAIEAGNPCRRLPGAAERDAWGRRWLRALSRSAVRHRNLLVMSPWSLFPAGSADLRYANLLSLLLHADACTFRRRLSLERWNLNEFKHFHQHTWAVMQHVQARAGVAERL